MRMNKFEFALFLAITLAALLWSTRASAEMLLLPSDPKVRMPEIVEPPVMPPDRERRRPIWRPPQPSDLPFRVTNSRVDVRIEENVATTTIEQSFLNLSNRDLEVRVMIPLPKGAAINKSALSMNDQMVEGRLYNAQEAQSIYESIVMQRRDPALLRFAGENLYEARVFPIPPNQERRLKFAYDQVLAPVSGLYDFRHILAGSQLYRGGLENFQFECVIRSKSALGPVYSPSHTVAVSRPDERTATVRFNGQNLSTDKDFRLYYAPSAEDVALRLVTHRDATGEDGYFMLIGRPDDQLEKGRILTKEIAFVLDVSGSMAGEKLEQAQKALSFCLNQLGEQDRFNLITFSTDVKALSDGKLLTATKENVKKALRAVETLEATGGTDIDGALRTALANDFTEGPTKTKIIIFLTDGLPSVGITDAGSILKDVSQSNARHKARIYSFGVGTDVNTHLLDKIALDCEGASSYVAPKEDLELKVSDFYAKVKNPVMTDLAFDFGPDVRTHSLYPKKAPALFKGSELLLFGRYKGNGPTTVSLKGNVAGEPREIRIQAQWPTQERDNEFLPRVWAMRKIGHLLEDIRLRGSNQETINEIVQLSQRHGIVTPYTSQLVLEPGMEGGGWRRRGVPPPAGGFGGGGMPLEDEVMLRREMDGRRASKAPAAPAATAAAEAHKGLAFDAEKAKEEAQQVAQTAGERKSGDIAVALAETERLLKDAKTDIPASQPPAETGRPADRNEAAARELRDKALLAGNLAKQQVEGADASYRARYLAVAQELSVKQIGTRTFYLRAGAWTDSQLKAEHKPTQLKAFSKEYFELLKKHSDLGPVMALGGRILVVVDGQAYQIEPVEEEAK
jgi:Ca-activated chloride channel family protein